MVVVLIHDNLKKKCYKSQIVFTLKKETIISLNISSKTHSPFAYRSSQEVQENKFFQFFQFCFERMTERPKSNTTVTCQKDELHI